MDFFSDKKYKVRLANGRVLGPLDLERIALLIIKNHIVGTETAREHPDGEWQDINAVPELAEMLLKHAQGKLVLEVTHANAAHGYRPIRGRASSVDPRNPTTVLPGAAPAPVDVGSMGSLPELQTLSAPLIDGEESHPVPQAAPPAGQDKPASPAEPAPAEPAFDEEKTRVAGSVDEIADDKTMVGSLDERAGSGSASLVLDQDPGADSAPLEESGGGALEPVELGRDPQAASLAKERTVMLDRETLKKLGAEPKPKKSKRQELVRIALIVVAIGMGAYLFLGGDGDKPSGKVQLNLAQMRAELPTLDNSHPDPQKSQKIYGQAMAYYVKDTAKDYKIAAGILRKAAAADPNNVKALAMLASCYLNLIDNSNKDENYFAVISKLIELARAKGKAIDLPETVIAEVEFYVTVNKPEAAENRIVDYTKTHQQFDNVMFYYLAYAFYNRGDPEKAARYLSQYPDSKVFSPKVFYLRGLVAEALNDPDSAMQQYEKALAMNKEHARSHARLAVLMNRKNELKKAAQHIEFVVTHPDYLPPKELAKAFYLRSLLSGTFQKWDVALDDIEHAIALDKDNSEYLVEYYTLKNKLGAPVAKLRKDAQMYFFLGEGEKALNEGRTQDALTQFLRAREANIDSPLPLVKIGDMFIRMHNIVDARDNYKKAADRAPKDIDIWSKYIDVLIQSYEWDTAEKAMDQFRKLPVSQSAIDKAAADMYEKQGQFAEAQMFYKKAMARQSIDSSVYLAYAKSLVETHNFKAASFFFSLALRFDPLSFDAIEGTAKCIASTESIDRAITFLQDELQKGHLPKAQILGAIAELEIQQGEWDTAQKYVDQARAADPDYAYPWKLQGEIYMNGEGIKKDALDNALAAYKSYSDRNPSDPSGYFERYKIFIKKTQFEQASAELTKIFATYPKYPNLHYYKGALYTIMGNHKSALEEYNIEFQNNPNNVPTLVALGKEYIELGNPTKALELFNKAMQINPMSADAKQNSAYANYLLKNYAGAIALFHGALALDRGNPLIYKRMGMAYRDMGDRVQAGQAFHMYLQLEPDAPDAAEFSQYR